MQDFPKKLAQQSPHSIEMVHTGAEEKGFSLTAGDSKKAATTLIITQEFPKAKPSEMSKSIELVQSQKDGK